MRVNSHSQIRNNPSIINEIIIQCHKHHHHQTSSQPLLFTVYTSEPYNQDTTGCRPTRMSSAGDRKLENVRRETYVERLLADPSHQGDTEHDPQETKRHTARQCECHDSATLLLCVGAPERTDQRPETPSTPPNLDLPQTTTTLTRQ